MTVGGEKLKRRSSPFCEDGKEFMNKEASSTAVLHKGHLSGRKLFGRLGGENGCVAGEKGGGVF